MHSGGIPHKEILHSEQNTCLLLYLFSRNFLDLFSTFNLSCGKPGKEINNLKKGKEGRKEAGKEERKERSEGRKERKKGEKN